jgi:hypothetical protein
MAQNAEKWGRATAKERYGSKPLATFSPPTGDQSAPQCPEDKQGPDYDNDAPNNWVRGMPNAEGKPGFDKGSK